MIIPVILCGGSGTGLWPLSRDLYPKQLMPMMDGNKLTLLQVTARRIGELVPGEAPIVVCNENHRFMVAVQLQKAGIVPRSIILEPCGRNTAPAIAVAAMEAMKLAEGSDPLLLVMPADHYMEKTAPLAHAIARGKRWAEKGDMVTFGIKPLSAETQYGYIGMGEELTLEDSSPDNPRAFRVTSFVEKPDSLRAQALAGSGACLWNSGIFLFKCSTFLDHLTHCAPEVVEHCSKAHSEAERDLDFLRLDCPAFETCPDSSIDSALMEKVPRSIVFSLDTGWQDIGVWSHLYEVTKKDDSGNVTMGDVIVKDVRNSYIHATNRMVTALGVDNLVIVETKDAVFIAPMDRVQDVKEIVRQLQEEGREEVKVHSKVYRPWGAYECVDFGERFQVKRITVNPGSKLSLQKHFHRAEHWVVVKGTARVRKGEDDMVLSENQSTYVPLGTVHRLENPGRIPLEIIEIQTGSYLEEDDIVRHDDVYGRIRAEDKQQKS